MENVGCWSDVFMCDSRKERKREMVERGGGLQRQNTWYALKIDLIFVSFVAA